MKHAAESTVKQLRLIADKLEGGAFELKDWRLHIDDKSGIVDYTISFASAPKATQTELPGAETAQKI